MALMVSARVAISLLLLSVLLFIARVEAYDSLGMPLTAYKPLPPLGMGLILEQGRSALEPAHDLASCEAWHGLVVVVVVVFIAGWVRDK